MKDIENSLIEPGDLIRYNFGIPPTTVDLFVFGTNQSEFLNVVDHRGVISTLTEVIANSSTIVLKG
jgi:hypothetical protein